MSFKIVCIHKKKAPWVLLPDDSSHSKYVCMSCSNKILKKQIKCKHEETVDVGEEEYRTACIKCGKIL